MLLSAAPATYADVRREPYRHAALAELLIRDRTKGCAVNQCPSGPATDAVACPSIARLSALLMRMHKRKRAWRSDWLHVCMLDC